jgi:hypothetical protein
MKMMSSFLLFFSIGEFESEEESAFDSGSVKSVGAEGIASVEDDIIW